VGYGTADSTSKGESGVEGHARKLLRVLGGDSLFDGIELGRAGGSWRSRHCDERNDRVSGEGRGYKIDDEACRSLNQDLRLDY